MGKLYDSLARASGAVNRGALPVEAAHNQVQVALHGTGQQAASKQQKHYDTERCRGEFAAG